MIHATGVIDRWMATWLCEAITEATAQEIAAKMGFLHYPTYPEEVGLLRDKLVPALQITGLLPAKDPILALARLSLHPKALVRDMTVHLAGRMGGGVNRWRHVLGPEARGVEELRDMVFTTSVNMAARGRMRPGAEGRELAAWRRYRERGPAEIWLPDALKER